MISFENGKGATLIIRDDRGTGALSLAIPSRNALHVKIRDIGHFSASDEDGFKIAEIVMKLIRGDCVTCNEARLELHQLMGPSSVDPDPVDGLMEQVSQLTPNQLEDLARRAGALQSKREKGRKFDVRLTAMAHVQARETVYADTAEDAASAALSWADGVEWTYDGLCEGEDQGPEVSSAEEIQ